MSDDDHVKSGRLKRLLAGMARLTARTTGDLLAGSAGRRRSRASESGASTPEMTRAAERILGTLGELKGAALKLGQALAMDPDALPPEARKIVAKLLSQAPERMAYERVRQADDRGATGQAARRDATRDLDRRSDRRRLARAGPLARRSSPMLPSAATKWWSRFNTPASIRR